MDFRNLSDKELVAYLFDNRIKLQEFKYLSVDQIQEENHPKLWALMEVSNRMRYGRKENPAFDSSGSHGVAEYMREKLAGLYFEEFWVLYLNRKNRVLAREKISQGGLAMTSVDVRIILRKAIDCRATAMILVHNHPSGCADPSGPDVAMTEKIKTAARYFDIAVLDHVIVTDDEHYSFADSGKI